MRRLAAEAAQLRRRLPQEANDFERAVAIGQELRTTWLTLGEGDGIPEEALELLREAGDRGAPIDRLTSEVVGWLKRHGLEGSLRVVLRTTP